MKPIEQRPDNVEIQGKVIGRYPETIEFIF